MVLIYKRNKISIRNFSLEFFFYLFFYGINIRSKRLYSSSNYLLISTIQNKCSSKKVINFLIDNKYI